MVSLTPLQMPGVQDCTVLLLYAIDLFLQSRHIL